MSGGVQGGFARKVPISGLKVPQGRLRACYQHLGAITSVPYKIQCGQKVIRCKGKNESGSKKTVGHEKKGPKEGAFFQIRDCIVTSVKTSPANTPNEDGTCRLVVNVAHRIGGLAEDHGLDAEGIDNSDTGADLLIDQHLRQR